MSGVSIATGVSALDVLNPSSAAAVVGAAYKRRSVGPSIGFSSGTYSNVALTTRTWQHIIAAPEKYYAVRVRYRNGTASAYTVDKTNITPSGTYVANGDPTGGASPVNITWSGSTSVTVGAQPAVGQETFSAWSDWAVAPAMDWAGVTNGRCLAYIRSYIALANYPYFTNANLAAYPDNALGGLVRQCGFANGDYIATPTGFVGAGGSQVALPMDVQFLDVSGALVHGGIGDSTYNCSTYTAGGQLNNWGEAACRELSVESGRRHSYMNFGWSSQGIRGGSAGAYSERLDAILASTQYDSFVIQTYSPNNAPSTQAALDADISTVLQMINKVRTHGAIPILTAGIPAVALNAVQDALRLQSNDVFAQLASAMRIPWIDHNPEVSDFASPARLLATASSDGTHLTTVTGQVAIKDRYKSSLRLMFG